MDDRVLFLREFLKHPRQIGSIIPSSRFLEKRLMELGEVASAKTIVELGSGTGGTTRAILAAMPEDARLLCIEINPRFCAWLENIKDPRLIVHCGSAADLRELLEQYALPAPDMVLSGIPFSTMGDELGTRIIETIHSTLSPGGRFIAYQVRDQVSNLSSPIMGTPHFERELLNIPPVRVYRWQKEHAAEVQLNGAASEAHVNGAAENTPVNGATAEAKVNGSAAGREASMH